MMSTADDIPALEARLAPPMDTRQRGFWIALGCALLFHAALLVEINRGGALRRAGTAEGADNAIAVELVTEADLKSRETVALPPPGGAPPSQKPSVEPQPEPPPPEKAETPPETPVEPVPPAPEPPAPEPPQPEKQAAVTPPPEPTPPAPETKSEVPAFETLVPDLADQPPPDTKNEAKPEEKPEEKKPEPAEKTQPEPAEKQTKPEAAQKQVKPQQPAKKKQAKLDLTPPSAMPSVQAIGPGRAAGASRPPGITRSGENDDFGRGVIRALRATMPPPNGTFGRVTVRLVLNNNGDLAEIQVLEPSGKPGLDQNVVFSTKQAYFPLPPNGSTTIDRTFLITYVYR
jgi:TonB family protein